MQGLLFGYNTIVFLGIIICSQKVMTQWKSIHLGQDTEPQTAPDLFVGHQFMNVCMNYCKLLWTTASAKCPKCKYKM